MRQALHIFKKDIRFLRYHIALTLVVTAAFAEMSILGANGPGPTVFILPVTWWFLIAAVIHAEPLPGTGHFWLTRPYRRKSLLGAKILFIVAFINIPMLIADLVIVRASGFSATANFGGFIWTQVLLLAAFEIPSAAIASLTSGLLELLVATLFLIFAGLVSILIAPMTHVEFSWKDLDWVKQYYVFGQIAAGCSVILLCQYAYRATRATRIAAGLGLVLLFSSAALLPWTTAFELQKHVYHNSLNTSSAKVRLDSERQWAARVYLGDNQDVVADIPIQVDGVPSGVELRPYGVEMSLLAPDGEGWKVKAPPPDCFRDSSGAISLHVTVERNWFEEHKREPLQLAGELYYSLYGKRHRSSIPLNGDPAYVDGVGLCKARSQFLVCNSAFRRSPGSVDVELTQQSRNGAARITEQLADSGSSTPFASEFNIDPLFRLSSSRLVPISDVLIVSSKPVTYSQSRFSIDGFVLANLPFQR